MKQNTEIKICGITQEIEVSWLVEQKVDYAGFVVFFPKSKRNLTIEQAKPLIDKLHAQSSIKAVAVTVSPTKEQVQAIEQAGFDIIQVHKETDAEAINAITIPLIRAVAIDKEKADEKIEVAIQSDMAAQKAFALLFDAKEPGSGSVFDWERLSGLDRGDKKLFLAGGIHAGNVADGIKTVKPDVVDISSGVEYNKERVGKDPEKIREFVRKVRDYE